MTSEQHNSNAESQVPKQKDKLSPKDLTELSQQIKQWGIELGFDQVGISDGNISEHETHLNNWLDKGMHGDMAYMHKHGTKRTRPNLLVEGTKRVISVRMDYAPADIKSAEKLLEDQNIAYISRYALGRDYHKVLRARLKKLAVKVEQEVQGLGYRVFTDSAPVMEKALAEKAGLGWIGKHSNLLDSKTGSWFFLGEIYVNLPLPVDKPATNHCGSCTKCIDVCPTQAIVGPYQVDARLCISYLTIELKGSIPTELRPKLGNRIYGCDDCQFVCPWNKFAQTSKEADFSPRAQLTDKKLVDLFNWSEEEFLKNTEGSAIRRIGYESWQRNIAVALGNVETNNIQDIEQLVSLLSTKRENASPMVQEHIDWAIAQLSN